jgi:prophage antirepressor-like protein
MALKRLDNDEVTKFNLGGLRGEVNIINESGLYSLVMRSRKPKAKAFRRWVTGEVQGNLDFSVNAHHPQKGV